MKRGDLVTVALQGDFGKPRPALIIQADHFSASRSVTVLPVSSTLVDAPLFRITINPDEETGLRQISQIMVDKIITVRREKIGHRIGCIDMHKLVEVDRLLAVFLGLAK